MVCFMVFCYDVTFFYPIGSLERKKEYLYNVRSGVG